MIRKILLITLAMLGLSTGLIAAEPKPSVGVVNFTSCMSDSKLGKQEQSSFDALKEQMGSLLQDTEKQINELAAKFNDADYMDGLSPEAEEEMQNKFRMLNEEMQRYQNQYYQVMQQANMKVMQTLTASIQDAAERVAKDKRLNMVMSKETCFFSAPTLDITNIVVAEMDKAFDQNLPQVEKAK